MHEQVIEWRPAAGIDAPCAGVDIAEMGGKLTMTLLFSGFIGGIETDLRVHFDRVIALMSHEESAHPWNDTQIVQPKFSGKWSGYTFPCLEVVASAWIASFGESRLFGLTNVRHFQIVTLDKSVDVLTSHSVIAEWLAG